MSDWKIARLEELAAPAKSAMATGPFGSAVSSKNFRSQGIPMLRGSNLSEDVGTRLIESDLVYLDPDLVETFKRSVAKAGDLIFTCWGSVGQIGFLDGKSKYDKYIVSNKQMKLTPDQTKVVPLFLYYYLSQPAMLDLVKGQAIGSTIPGFNLGQLRALPVQLPIRAEQRAIAEALGALDDKIAANVRASDTVSALAETHFRNLMTAAIKEVTLGNILTLEYGKPLPAPSREAGIVPVYGSGGIVGLHNQSLVGGPGVIVGRKGTAGAVHWSPVPHFAIDTTYFVIPKDPKRGAHFCYFVLKSLKLNEQNSDSAVPGLNRNDAYSMKLQLPDDDKMRAFNELVKPLFYLSAQLAAENYTLAATRDALLPQLMSGKLRVRDAEKTVEAVA